MNVNLNRTFTLSEITIGSSASVQCDSCEMKKNNCAVVRLFHKTQYGSIIDRVDGMKNKKDKRFRSEKWTKERGDGVKSIPQNKLLDNASTSWPVIINFSSPPKNHTRSCIVDAS